MINTLIRNSIQYCIRILIYITVQYYNNIKLHCEEIKPFTLIYDAKRPLRRGRKGTSNNRDSKNRDCSVLTKCMEAPRVNSS